LPSIDTTFISLPIAFKISQALNKKIEDVFIAKRVTVSKVEDDMN
jgi:DNA-binding XRE family transcriptional regulator